MLTDMQLHFSAIKAYNDIYLHGHRFTKDPKFYGPLHQDDSLLCLIDLREVKTRREILGPLFSRRAILKLEHVVQSKVRSTSLRPSSSSPSSARSTLSLTSSTNMRRPAAQPTCAAHSGPPPSSSYTHTASRRTSPSSPRPHSRTSSSSSPR